MKAEIISIIKDLKVFAWKAALEAKGFKAVYRETSKGFYIVIGTGFEKLTAGSKSLFHLDGTETTFGDNYVID